ncbi:transglutaminase domain-containing protein [Lachnoclostridium sp. Marseille-P6806]|uniref:transglutaminase domain-containing protein n=1 Tax=Lachnoclostridium sp. Marseille-P6806 TaxID=2364793 RepID=UPI0013EEF590|nr:transglutaminase domain-containing protein [Lachnoclostridium sp. Marseille-P6806]
MENFLIQSRDRIQREFDRLCMEFPVLAAACKDRIAGEPEALQRAMRYLYASMPLSDAVTYPYETFRDYAVWSLHLYEMREDVRALPEEMFLQYVLFCRVNEEELLPCRTEFGRELERTIGAARGVQAAIDINYWCAAQGTYRSDDRRTISALYFFRRGYGRCGEESTFAVQAMRAFGIPARQVYVPRWAHCEDNHAWIEVFADGRWHFTGACEPLEILDRGWFTEASSRAMLVHSRYFGHVTEPVGEDIVGAEGVVTVLNQLHRYAKTVTLRIGVFRSDGTPASGADVRVMLLNEAEYVDVARLRCDENGEAFFTTGLGSLRLRALSDGEEETLQLDAGRPAALPVRLRLKKTERPHPQTGRWEPVDFRAPEAAEINPQRPTEEEKQRGRERLAVAAAQREATRSGYENPGLSAFLRREDGQKNAEEAGLCRLRGELLSQLSEKDRTDADGAVLSSHFANALPYREGMEPGLFSRYVMNPRVEYEILRSYREEIISDIPASRQEEYRKNPERLWRWIRENIRSFPKRERESVVTPPGACWMSRTGSNLSKRILFVAACRTLGIPARLRPMDGALEYWDGGRFVPVEENRRQTGRICFIRRPGETLSYAMQWTAAERVEEEYRTLRLEKFAFDEKNMLEIPTVPGDYRVITENRLPNGNILAAERYFTVMEGETVRAELELREAAAEEMLESVPLPEFYLHSCDGAGALPGSGLTKEKGTILFWLDEGREPTEHILGELYELRARFAGRAGRLCFVVRGEASLENPLVRRVREALPGSRVFFDSFEENVQVLARKMYVDPGSLPLIILTGGPLDGAYASAGYNVGTGEMLLKLLAAVE